MEINGLPAHVLMIHAAVVFVPLAAAAAIVYAAVPRWRWATRLPMLAFSAGALGAVVLAYFTGRNLRDSYADSDTVTVPPGVAAHQERADVLLWLTIVFFVFVVAAAWALGGPSSLISGRGSRERHNPLIEWSTIAMVVPLALFLIAMVIYTGDAGTRSVWEDKWESVQ